MGRFHSDSVKAVAASFFSSSDRFAGTKAAVLSRVGGVGISGSCAEATGLFGAGSVRTSGETRSMKKAEAISGVTSAQMSAASKTKCRAAAWWRKHREKRRPKPFSLGAETRGGKRGHKKSKKFFFPRRYLALQGIQV